MTHINSYGTLTYKRSLNPSQKTITYNNLQKEENLKNCRLSVPADLRINLKKCEKKDKYLDLAGELKNLWNMKVTIVPIVIGTFGTIGKRLLNGLEDLKIGVRVETL